MIWRSYHITLLRVITKQNPNFITFFCLGVAVKRKMLKNSEMFVKIMKLANTRIIFNNSSGVVWLRERTGKTPYLIRHFELILFKTGWSLIPSQCMHYCVVILCRNYRLIVLGLGIIVMFFCEVTRDLLYDGCTSLNKKPEWIEEAMILNTTCVLKYA